MNTILIISILTIGVIITLIGLLFILKKSSPKPIKKVEIKNNRFDLDDLMAIVKNPNSSNDAVLDALIYFNENFVIDENNKNKVFLFLSRVLTHPSKNKNIFQYFHKELKPKNKNYKIELESIENKALS